MNRRTMDYSPTVDSRTAPAGRWPRPSLARHPRGAQWGALDFAFGGALARFTRALSPVPNLPSPLPAVGARRGAAQRAGSLSPRLTRARGDRPERRFHRRPLCGGEKGGRAVGPTKRGKGTKLLGV